VLIVGDKPGKGNVSKHVAFVGAACEPRLVQWLIQMGCSSYNVWLINQVDPTCRHIARGFNLGNKPVIALGKAAQGFLYTCQVSFLGLPHPSGLNRQINDKEAILEELHKAHQYIREVSRGMPVIDGLQLYRN